MRDILMTLLLTMACASPAMGQQYFYAVTMAGFLPGLHTIAVVGDANGTGSGGIGSRYFVVRQP